MIFKIRTHVNKELFINTYSIEYISKERDDSNRCIIKMNSGEMHIVVDKTFDEIKKIFEIDDKNIKRYM